MNEDEKYRILFEKSKDAFLIIENNQFVDCNQATVDMLGYKNKTDLLQTHPSALSPRFQPDGRDSFSKAVEMIEIAVKNGSHRFEWDHIRADGNILPVEVLLTTISNRKNQRIIHTIWRDISDRRAIEAIRKKEKETISTILESIPVGIVLFDDNGRYHYVSPYFSKITGYTLEDIPTRKDWFQQAYPDENDRKKASDAWDKDNKNPNLPNMRETREFRIRCKDGQLKHMEFRSTFLKELKISVLNDITSRKESEDLVRERDRLEGILELSGAVCHEMNQPLMSIQGYFDLIRMDISENDPLYSRIEKIKKQLDRLTGIIKKLMDISRYETKEYLTEKILDLSRTSDP